MVSWPWVPQGPDPNVRVVSFLLASPHDGASSLPWGPPSQPSPTLTASLKMALGWGETPVHPLKCFPLTMEKQCDKLYSVHTGPFALPWHGTLPDWLRPAPLVSCPLPQPSICLLCSSGPDPLPFIGALMTCNKLKCERIDGRITCKCPLPPVVSVVSQEAFGRKDST